MPKINEKLRYHHGTKRLVSRSKEARTHYFWNHIWKIDPQGSFGHEKGAQDQRKCIPIQAKIDVRENQPKVSQNGPFLNPIWEPKWANIRQQINETTDLEQVMKHR